MTVYELLSSVTSSDEEGKASMELVRSHSRTVYVHLLICPLNYATRHYLTDSG
jgi:hypothetical protein